MKNQIYENHKSSLGNVSGNVVSMLAYLAPIIISFIPRIGIYIAWIIPIIIYLLEKDSRFVKFHALQSFLLNIVGTIIGIVILIVGAVLIGGGAMIGGLTGSAGGALIITAVTLVIAVIMLILDILAMIGAYKYREYHIPIIGNLAMNISNKAE